MANRLANETSPYLLQHAENPVDWYPWGDEAFATARAQDKPVLLSIGYSACHWCHVMAHESFEDRATAEYINQHFVAVKVDREERPDVDDIYMQATLFFNRGQGGWPMTVFLTPDGLPFHAGTYYPPEPRYGMPGFRQVMEAVIDVYRNRRDEVEQTGRGVISELSRELEGAPAGADLLTTDLLDDASDAFIRRADPVHGGLTREKPKFPNPVNLEYLLRFHHATGSEPSLQVVLLALRKMADGGLNDQLGGGFHRYSVDERWLVPHFEKMLYDNALLARVYLHAYQITGEMVFRDVVEDTLDYILREMTSPNGGFYSAQDADSEGEEGKFYVWTFEEFREALDGVTDHLDALIAYWGLTPAGNFEGKNILNVPDMLERVAVRHGLTVEQMREEVAATRAVLFTLRKRRVAPARDDKVLAAWNGMTLAALAEAARVLDRDDYRDAAARSARFLLGEMSGADGRLFRTHKDGASKINAYLEDYAHVIDGLLELYMTTFETRWFSEAQRLADVVLEHFRAEEGGFYDTSDDHDPLVMRPRSTQDNVMPSGSAQMAYNLLRLTGWTGETRYEDAALGVYRALGETLRSYPMAFGMMLIGVDLYLRRPVEIALVGDPSQPEIGAMLRVAREPYRPRALVALSPANAGADAVPALLRGRTLREGSPAGYVCENFVCAAPVTSSAALAGQLNRASPERGLAPGR